MHFNVCNVCNVCNRDFITARHWAHWLAVRMTLPATWLHHLEESFSYKEIQFKTFAHLQKTSCLPAVNETPAHGSSWPGYTFAFLGDCCLSGQCCMACPSINLGVVGYHLACCRRMRRIFPVLKGPLKFLNVCSLTWLGTSCYFILHSQFFVFLL